jgi:hypothetical protein
MKYNENYINNLMFLLICFVCEGVDIKCYKIINVKNNFFKKNHEKNK